VAVIHKGELRGIGVVEDLRSKSNAMTEVVWQGSSALASVAHLVTETHATGEIIRAVTSAQDLDVLLEKLRQQRAHLISVTPVHGTLEDYFLTHTSEPEAAKV
jgi:phage terminase large subunit-like protein